MPETSLKRTLSDTNSDIVGTVEPASKRVKDTSIVEVSRREFEYPDHGFTAWAMKDAKACLYLLTKIARACFRDQHLDSDPEDRRECAEKYGIELDWVELDFGMGYDEVWINSYGPDEETVSDVVVGTGGTSLTTFKKENPSMNWDNLNTQLLFAKRCDVLAGNASDSSSTTFVPEESLLHRAYFKLANE